LPGPIAPAIPTWPIARPISPFFEAEEAYQQDYVIEPAIFDPGLSYSFSLGQPQVLDWISLETEQSNPFFLTADTDITVTLTATAPTWLAYNQVYTERVPIVITENGTGKQRVNFLDLEVEKTILGIQLYTNFELGPLVLIQEPLASTGLIYARLKGCPPSSGGPPPPPSNSAGPSDGWEWTPLPSGGGLRGVRISSSGGGGSAPPFPQVVEAPAQIVGTADYQVRMELSQRLVMQGQGFQASLSMQNLFTDQSVDNIQVSLIISDAANAEVTSSFIITPPVPSLLAESLPPGQQAAGDWLILPAMEITATEGITYQAQAVISYTIDGVSQSFTTLPEEFTVLPAPDLIIDYELPDPNQPCTLFDLKATLRNVGYGSARGISLSSSQPRVVDNTSNSPQGFEIIGVSVNNQPQEELNLNVELGEIPPGQSQQIVWRIRANEPGRMIEFTSDYRVENYYNAPLAPRLSAITTTFATPENPFLYGCLTGAFNIAGKVEDEIGNPITDVVFALGYGSFDTGIVASTIISPLIDASGAYTIPNLGTGTYTVVPFRPEDLNAPLAFSQAKPYTVSPAGLGAAMPVSKGLADITSMSANYNAIPSFRTAILSTDDSAGNDFILLTAPVITLPTTGFKGANWLRYDDQTDQTLYKEKNVGWNLDAAWTIDIDNMPPDEWVRVRDLGQQIVNFSDPNVNVFTIVRLGKKDDLPRNPDPDYYVDKPCNDKDIQGWMKTMDTQYEDVILRNSAIASATTKPVRIFILGNEPNHNNDEWNISGAAYAHLYNCYYTRWKGKEEGYSPKSELLYVAGPGQNGPCYNETCKNWTHFYEEMLIPKAISPTEVISDTDGFAIHAYGYYTPADEDGNASWGFRDWLTRTNTINSQPTLKQKPIIVTEYNPGIETHVNPHVIHVPPGDWEDWFTKTYCWTKSKDIDPNGQIIGLLYFTDEGDYTRSLEEGKEWYGTSLRNTTPPDDIQRDKHWENRRIFWLDVSEQDCYSKPPGDPSPLIGNALTQSRQNTQSIGGVISGTLGQLGYNDIYYVTDDLEVPAGQTLTIAPGTSLVFASGRGMDIAGQLIAEGNDVYPIRFLSIDEAGWAGLSFQSSAQGSRCTACHLENLGTRMVALQVEAPITFKHGLIRDVPGGTAISSTVPLSLSNVIIDYVGTGLHFSSPVTTHHSASHLTLSRCQQAVVNQGQTVSLNNSIITVCGVGISTELSGTTVVSYTLFNRNIQDSITEAGAQLIQGPGLLTTTPGFVDFPNNFHMRADSPAVNTADPRADYSQEPGYNGGRADMGAYGNTRGAPQQPPLDQMAATLTTATPTQTGQPGQMISYTVTLKNNGTVTDNYRVSLKSLGPGLRATLLYPDGDAKIPLWYTPDLAPQEQISFTVWVSVSLTSPLSSTQGILVAALGAYGAWAPLELTLQVPSFQEHSGQAVIEAEHFAEKIDRSERTWLTTTILSGYVGPGYLSALPDIDQQFTTAYTTTSPELHYTINFTTTGVYTVWLRGYVSNAAGDSLYVALDNQPVATTLTGFVPGQWSWANSDAQGSMVTIEVAEPGVHTLHLWQREDGLRLDRIVLTTNNSYTPDGNGPPESEIR
jgi:hypothetical protein